MTALVFEEFPKIPRFKREVVITEKVDGTNAQIAYFELTTPELLEQATADPFCLQIIHSAEDGGTSKALYVGSRQRWLRPEKGLDNFGFAAWVMEHDSELQMLGPGRHFGEWYGCGIQRGYDLPDKRFALFNVARWNDANPNRPPICDVVPVLGRGEALDDDVIMRRLDASGSAIAPGFKSPEGIIVYHTASRQMYKRTFRDDGGKWKAAA